MARTRELYYATNILDTILTNTDDWNIVID